MESGPKYFEPSHPSGEGMRVGENWVEIVIFALEKKFPDH
jgi:hypothetical protein